MKDIIGHPAPPDAPVPDGVKADAMHALGHFYLRQGFPKQALALLLGAQALGNNDASMTRALAHASLLCGAPKKALSYLDEIEATKPVGEVLEACRLLRGRALLAMGRVAEAQMIFKREVGASRQQKLLARNAPSIAKVRKQRTG